MTAGDAEMPPLLLKFEVGSRAGKVLINLLPITFRVVRQKPHTRPKQPTQTQHLNFN